MENALIIVSVISLFFSLIALAASGYALHYGVNAVIELKAFQKSTHNIQMVPVDALLDSQSDREINKKINKIDKRAYDDLDEEDIEDESVKT